MDLPCHIVFPATCWCSWSWLQNLPWIAWKRSPDVDKTCNRFLMGACDFGSCKFPTRHKSKRHRWLNCWISSNTGNLNMSKPPGCSQWKWELCDICSLNSTTPKAICHTFWKRFSHIFSSRSRDLHRLRKFHIDHGPHSGLYQRLLGRLIRMVRNNRSLAEVCFKSPSDNPKRWALPLSWSTWFVSSLLSEQMTSRTSRRAVRMESRLSFRSMFTSFSNTVIHFLNSWEKLMGCADAWNSKSTWAGSDRSCKCDCAQSAAWRLVASWSRSTLTSRTSPGCPWCERSALGLHSRSHTSVDACCGDWPACWSSVPEGPSHDCSLDWHLRSWLGLAIAHLVFAGIGLGGFHFPLGFGIQLFLHEGKELLMWWLGTLGKRC